MMRVSIEHQDDNQTDDMDDANTKNQDHQPLLITEHNFVRESLERVLDSLQHCSVCVHDAPDVTTHPMMSLLTTDGDDVTPVPAPV